MTDDTIEKEKVTVAIAVAARNLGIRRVIHLLDELGFYYTNRNVDIPQLNAVISSELTQFLADPVYRQVIDVIVANSNLIGIDRIYKNIGLKIGSDHNGTKIISD